MTIMNLDSIIFQMKRIYENMTGMKIKQKKQIESRDLGVSDCGNV
jgi:hypothetical protein